MVGGDTFSPLAPVLPGTKGMSLTTKLAMSPSSTVHGGQYDTKYVPSVKPLHAASVTDTFWGVSLEPACSRVFKARSGGGESRQTLFSSCLYYRHPYNVPFPDIRNDPMLVSFISVIFIFDRNVHE